MKRLFAFVLAICMLTTAFAGCGQQANTPTEPKADQASTNEVEKKDEKPAKDVDLTFFTGKVETVDLLDEIIADFNAQSGGITVEQEYQNDASNCCKSAKVSVVEEKAYVPFSSSKSHWAFTLLLARRALDSNFLT